MGDIKLFDLRGNDLTEILGESYTIEKTLQKIIESNLETMLGVKLLDSEYSTGKTHSGRIDTLGIDENGSPVIIEYKRASNENVINQGLYYLDWLLDHKAEYTMLVERTLGKEQIQDIDWATARLICIANQFLKYDEYAVKQIDRNIELFQYNKFGENLLLLELVNASTGTIKQYKANSKPKNTSQGKTTFESLLTKLDSKQLDLYENMRAFMLALGDDVQDKKLQKYEAYKRIANFACLEVHPQAGTIVLFLKLNPSEYQIEEGFSRDVSSIGHYGTGDLEITIRERKDIDKAMPLISRSYELN